VSTRRDLHDVALVSVAHDLGDARLHRLTEALADADLSVVIYGLGDTARAPTHATVVGLGSSSWPKRAARALLLPFRASGRVTVVVDPDLFPAAVLAGWLRRRPSVCDVHEDYALVANDRPWARRRPVRQAASLAARVATAIAARASATFVADAHVPPLTARQRVVVRNLPRRPELRPPTGELRAAYVGDVRASRGALTMIDAVMSTPPWELDVVGPLASEDRREILARAESCDRIRLHGRQDPKTSWEIVAGATVGMAVLDSTPAFAEAMPTKIFEYAGHGMAVVTSANPRPAEVVHAFGMGAVVNDAEELAATLSAWRDAPDALESCQARAAEWASTMLETPWSFELAAAAIQQFVDQGKPE
jgi:glycosyltransferase involved in cell wall biosynthesis